MAPFQFDATMNYLIALAIGFCFGFTLERSGFGNARVLAAQFYFYNMRVFKVMFTAIITAMVLIFLSSSIGLLDFDELWVAPTYMGPAIVGGLILGFGFIIGGYCPGTSLVSLSTLKVDGLFFVLGLLCGMLIYAETVEYFWNFWHQSGYMGRLTLADVLGVDAGLVVIVVFVGAIVAFFIAEKVEKYFGGNSLMGEPTRGIMRFRKLAVLGGLAICFSALVIGQPDIAKKVAWRSHIIDDRIASRTIHIDPGELLKLMHNHQIKLVLYDVRSESDYNMFHLLESKSIRLEELKKGDASAIPTKFVVVLISNDEKRAEQAYRYLAVSKELNLYILAGGINRWLEVFKDQKFSAVSSEESSKGDGTFRHAFEHALGSRHPFSRPDETLVSERTYKEKVKVLTPVKPVGGGCG